MAKILVIEDENRMAELLKRGLEESGHTVGTATNVSEGLRMFAYEKQDIIISDIMLPDGSGFDLCRDIRRQNENCAYTDTYRTRYDRRQTRRIRFGSG